MAFTENHSFVVDFFLYCDRISGAKRKGDGYYCCCLIQKVVRVQSDPPSILPLNGSISCARDSTRLFCVLFSSSNAKARNPRYGFSINRLISQGCWWRDMNLWSSSWCRCRGVAAFGFENEDDKQPNNDEDKQQDDLAIPSLLLVFLSL